MTAGGGIARGDGEVIRDVGFVYMNVKQVEVYLGLYYSLTRLLIVLLPSFRAVS